MIISLTYLPDKRKWWLQDHSKYQIPEWGMLHTAFSDRIHQTCNLYDKCRHLFSIFFFTPFQCTKHIIKLLLKGKAFQFNAMPNWYVDAIRVLNKVLKPPFAYLREQGLPSVVNVDGIGRRYFWGMSGQCFQHPYMLRWFEFLYTPREVDF